jgi:hypothetical protein
MFRIVSLACFALTGCVSLGDTGIRLSGEIVPPVTAGASYCALQVISAADDRVIKEFSVRGKFVETYINPPSRGRFYALAQCPGSTRTARSGVHSFQDAPEYPAALELGQLDVSAASNQ